MPTPEQVEAVARAIRAKDMSGWKTYGELAEVAAIAYEATRSAVPSDEDEERLVCTCIPYDASIPSSRPCAIHGMFNREPHPNAGPRQAGKRAVRERLEP